MEQQVRELEARVVLLERRAAVQDSYWALARFILPIAFGLAGILVGVYLK